MAMVRWDPFSEMMNVQRDMNRLFSSLGMPLYGTRGEGERVEWAPSVDVVKKGEDLHVRAELPGVRPEDIEVDVTGDMLSIRGKRREESEYAEGEYLRREFSYGSFERQVMLPPGVDSSAVRADYHDGILDVMVPGAARGTQQRAQRIPITRSDEPGARSRLREPRTEAREVPGEPGHAAYPGTDEGYTGYTGGGSHPAQGMQPRGGTQQVPVRHEGEDANR